MIIAAPNPDWRMFAAAVANPAPLVSREFEGAWFEPNANPVWMSRGAWSFWALANWWRDTYGRPIRMWLPDFFCTSTLEPARNAQACLTFYEIDENLNPDWEKCRSDTRETAPPDVFVLVHYFGIPADIGGAKDFAHRCGALILEDGAHALRPAAGIGSAGDFVLYCPHKLIGIPDGAVLSGHDKHVMQHLELQLSRLSPDSPESSTWLIRRLIQKLLPDSIAGILRTKAHRGFDQEFPATAIEPTPQISPVSMRMLKVKAPLLAIEAERRRQADAQIRAACSRIPDLHPVRQSWGSAAPYRTVMRCSDEAIAARMFVELQKKFMVETWGSMASEVKLRPDKHRRALELRKTLLLFPYDLDNPSIALDIPETLRRYLGQ